MRWLDGIYGISKASAFKGWLFENFVHEVLFDGGSFNIRSLSDPSSHCEPLILVETNAHYKRFTAVTSLEDILLQSYQMPASSTQASIDSYYADEVGLWLFQITKNVCHDVELEGLVDLLVSLNLLETVKANPSFVSLVFVVPTDMYMTYPKQKISKDPVFGDITYDHVMASDCSIVKGIEDTKKRKLNDAGISSVRQLMDAVDSPHASFVKRYVQQFHDKLKLIEEAETVENINQFVIGVDHSPSPS
jgi:hypothetical protein